MASVAPIVFGICPGASSDKRLSEIVSKYVTPYYAKHGLGTYDGSNPAQFEATLGHFVEKNCSYEGPLVIVVNTHGIEESGNFNDGTTVVTPQILFDGYDTFRGLKTHIKAYLRQPLSQRKVYLVLAQCYGKVFERGLQDAVISMDDELKGRITVEGLSSGSTHSIHSSDSSATISTEARHIEFSKWMEKTFKTTTDPGNAVQARGTGAKAQIAASASGWI